MSEVRDGRVIGRLEVVKRLLQEVSEAKEELVAGSETALYIEHLLKTISEEAESLRKDMDEKNVHTFEEKETRVVGSLQFKRVDRINPIIDWRRVWSTLEECGFSKEHFYKGFNKVTYLMIKKNKKNK